MRRLHACLSIGGSCSFRGSTKSTNTSGYGFFKSKHTVGLTDKPDYPPIPEDWSSWDLGNVNRIHKIVSPLLCVCVSMYVCVCAHACVRVWLSSACLYIIPHCHIQSSRRKNQHAYTWQANFLPHFEWQAGLFLWPCNAKCSRWR